MKPSEQWKAINDQQSRKVLPKNYKQPSGELRETKQKAGRVDFYFTKTELDWLRGFRVKHKSFYPTLDSAVEAILLNIINKPIENYLEGTLRLKKHDKRGKRTLKNTFVINRAIIDKLNSQPINGEFAYIPTKLLLVINNSRELHDKGWFQELTKRKTKNPTRKEVL